MRARPAIGTVLMAAGLGVAAIALPDVIGRERAVAAYEEQADAAADDEAAGGVDWAALRAANPSVVAWCAVEGTSVDLPVCQASDESPAYWLTHDLWGSESPAGTPYIDHRATADSQHLMCYGHHLAGTGGMFSDLSRSYRQAAFDRLAACGLRWSTPDGGTVRLRPLCASSQDMGFQAIQRFDFGDPLSFRAWLRDVCSQSSARAADAESLVPGASRAITLVTCSSDLAGRRERTLVTFVA